MQPTKIGDTLSMSIANKIGQLILNEDELSNRLELIHEILREHIDFQLLVLGTFNHSVQGMKVWGIVENSETRVLSKNLILQEGYWLTTCFRNKKEILVNDYSPEKYQNFFSPALSIQSINLRKSLIYVPLVVNDVCHGVLSVQAYKAGAFNDESLQLLKHIAMFVSMQIRHRRQHELLSKQQVEIRECKVSLKSTKKVLNEVIEQQALAFEKENKQLLSHNKQLEMLSIVARQTQNAIMIMNAKGDVLWLNDFFTKLYHYTLPEFIEKRGANILNTSFNPEIKQMVSKCIVSKEAITYEALNYTYSGSEIWTQTTLTPILDEQGCVENLVTIDTEITKRKIAERKVLMQKEKIEAQAKGLQEVNSKLERLSIVARQTENAIMIMDAEGNILWLNEYFTNIYEYTLEFFNSIRGKNILETSFNADIEETLNKCLLTREAQTYEALNVTFSGKKIWTQTTLTPVLDSDGNIKNLVTIDTNITKRKKFEAKIKKQNKNITDSIIYARRIQKAVMPGTSLLDELLSDYFVINKPRDIVSGDFYWAKKIVSNNKEYTVLVVADCTGHGVPGAFVSMLGISLLTDILSNCLGRNLEPQIILEELRERVKQTLNQRGSKTETKDGMDLALCVIDKQEQQIRFAGANNPLYHYRDEKGDYCVDVYKATRSPIGLYYREEKFVSQKFNYQSGDRIYLFSDGIVDQFGGENGRKFMSRNFRKLLLDISPLSMDEQKVSIKKSFESWRKGYDQLDDILVIGIEL